MITVLAKGIGSAGDAPTGAKIFATILLLAGIALILKAISRR